MFLNLLWESWICTKISCLGTYTFPNEMHIAKTEFLIFLGRYPNTDIASYLINNGNARVDAATKTGASALHGAALQGNTGTYH